MKESILVIDDNNEVPSYLKLTLEQNSDCQVEIVNGCKEAEQRFSANDYALVLIDIEMPDTDGYDTFERLKKIEKKTPSLFIFLSAHDDEKTTLKCYSLGADGFISKLTPGNLITQQITALLGFRERIEATHHNEQELIEMLDSSMLQTSIYGASLSLLSNMQYAKTEQALAEQTFAYIKQYQLNAAIYFFDGSQEYTFDCKTGVSSIIQDKVFRLLKSNGRIYEFDSRALFNENHISLLIKNMPEKDSTQYGIFIDALAKLIHAVEARYIDLINTQKLIATEQSLTKVIKEMEQGIIALSNDKKTEKKKIIEDIILKIRLSFNEMDFSEDQENFLTSLIEQTVEEQNASTETILNLSKDIATGIQLTEQVYFQEKADISENNIELF